MLGVSTLFGRTGFYVLFLVINLLFVATLLRLKKTATRQIQAPAGKREGEKSVDEQVKYQRPATERGEYQGLRDGTVPK